MMSMVWNISIGQLGLAAWLCSLPAPAHLLSSWIWGTGKSPWFHSSNWKHQCYQHSSSTKSKTQQLLRGKLTLSQPKPEDSCKAIRSFAQQEIVMSTSWLSSKWSWQEKRTAQSALVISSDLESRKLRAKPVICAHICSRVFLVCNHYNG